MNILGITHFGSFNSAACLLVNGKLIAFAEEERFNRIKHSVHKFPKHAIDFCLKTAGLTLSDIHGIGVGHQRIENIYSELYSKEMAEEWDIPSIVDNDFELSLQDEFNLLNELHSNQIFFDRIFRYDHHMCHVASSVFTSGFDKCNFFSCDHSGGSTAGRLGYFDGNELIQFDIMHLMGSIGYFYERMTGVLGFRMHSEEGKTMGLASYGDNSENNPFNEINLFKFNKRGVLHLDKMPLHHLLPQLTFVTEQAKKNILCHEATNLAAYTQRCLEQVFITNAKWLYNKTGCKNLAGSGGSFLNCSANGRLLQSDFIDQLYVVPASTDAGNALGSAILCHKDLTGTYPRIEFNDAYWGSSFTKEQVVNSIDTYNNANIRNNSSFKL